jgi:hypothetical protein
MYGDGGPGHGTLRCDVVGVSLINAATFGATVIIGERWTPIGDGS